MARFLSLAEAVQSNVRDGDTVAMEGFTHLIPHAAGHEIIRQQRKRLTLIRMTPGPDLRPAHRHGLRRQGGVLLGRQSRRRLAAPLPRRGRERLAAAARDRGAFPRRHGQRLRGRRRRPAAGGVPRLHRRRPAEGQSEDQAHHLSVHRRAACRRAVAPARRRDHPCAARRPRRQRDARRHRRRAEGGGARRQALDRHGRGGRRRFRAAQPQCGDPAALDRRRGRDRAGRRLSVLCAGLLQARQRLLHRLGQDRARARDASWPG